jgi:hypothetical protein
VRCYLTLSDDAGLVSTICQRRSGFHNEKTNSSMGDFGWK